MADLFVPGPVLTINRTLRMHRMRMASQMGEIRRSAALLARAHRLPHLARVHVTAQAHIATRRGQDADACHPTVKAAIDGLVDARVLDDDDADHVAAITYLTPALASDLGDGLHLHLEEIR